MATAATQTTGSSTGLTYGEYFGSEHVRSVITEFLDTMRYNPNVPQGFIELFHRELNKYLIQMYDVVITHPLLTNGKTEIHPFLLPLFPTPEQIARYFAAIAEYNNMFGTEMKGPVIDLRFRDPETIGKTSSVVVLQSSRYVDNDGDFVLVFLNMLRDGLWFVYNGFQLLRLKLETLEGGNTYYPRTIAEAQQYPEHYTENHIRIVKQGTTAPTEEELADVNLIVGLLSYIFGVPTPFSFNANGSVHGNEYQMYFNMRWHGLAYRQINNYMTIVTLLIEHFTTWKVKKIAHEYVYFDAFVSGETIVIDKGSDVDKGWIDPRAGETAESFQALFHEMEDMMTPEMQAVRIKVQEIKESLDAIYRSGDADSVNALNATQHIARFKAYMTHHHAAA